MAMLSREPRRTARLLLRLPRADDAAPLFTAYTADPLVTRYLVWRPHRSVEETRGYLSSRLVEWEAGRELTWILTEAAMPDVSIGAIALRPEDAYKATVGYVLARTHWGKGYMPEALRAVIGVAFKELNLYRVAALCDVDNAASARVMEKAGMVKEGLLRRYLIHPNVSPEPRDALLYAITR